jgi:hypothetical protein
MVSSQQVPQQRTCGWARHNNAQDPFNQSVSVFLLLRPAAWQTDSSKTSQPAFSASIVVSLHHSFPMA